MRFLFIIISFLLMNSSGDFKQNQLKYKRVREAYREKESHIKEVLSNHHIDMASMNIYLRVFKEEKILELWAKNTRDDKFTLIEEFPVCRTSGKEGPKRREGDLQIPEGFYHINVFNPYSNFHLSLGINYPNKSDKILSDKKKPGGEIFIHGSCVTIGCIPITDDKIKELYIYCIEAKDSGQEKIPVTIFPCKPEPSKLEVLSVKYKDKPDVVRLWNDLKKGYDYFNENKKLPKVVFNADGSHKILE